MISLISGYHPKSNRLVERVNQEIGWFLRSYCARNQNDWTQYLPWAEYAHNYLRHSANHLTPFQCVLGYQPPLFPTDALAVDTWFQQSKEVRAQVHRHLDHIATVNKHFTDHRRREAPVYHPGERVWLSIQDIRNLPGCRKLFLHYAGPFKVLKQINPVSYRFELPCVNCWALGGIWVSYSIRWL